MLDSFRRSRPHTVVVEVSSQTGLLNLTYQASLENRRLSDRLRSAFSKRALNASASLLHRAETLLAVTYIFIDRSTVFHNRNTSENRMSRIRTNTICDNLTNSQPTPSWPLVAQPLSAAASCTREAPL